MSIFSGLFRSRDKTTNATTGSSYRFFGGTTSGKAISERSAMQMTAGRFVFYRLIHRLLWTRLESN